MQPSFNKNNSQPCKFGMDCRFFKQGKCRNNHDMGGQNGPNMSQGYNKGGGGMGGNTGGNKGSRGPNNNWGGNKGYNNGPNNYPNPNQNQPKQNDQSYKFCKFYQHGQCKNQHCKKIHGFTQNNDITRLMYTQDMPTNPISSLGMFAKSGNNYFALKNAQQISFYEYKFQNNQIAVVSDPFVLPEDIQTHYFATKREWIFFAFVNKTNQLMNIAFYDIFTKECIIIQNAHQKPVTDMTFFELGNRQVLLSSSTDGHIKAWVPGDTGKYILEQNITQGFRKGYDNGSNAQILFMDRKQIYGTIALVAGTSDNRLLFWIAPNMQYRQAVLPNPYNRVLGAKFIKYNQAWIAVGLVWTSQKKSSALIVVDLNSFNPDLLLELPANTPYDLMAIMQSIGNYFLVGTIGGNFTIYKVPEFKNPVGFIMHRNAVRNIVSTTSTLQTGIKIGLLLVLEKMEPNRKGSFAIYKLNQ